MNQNIYFISGPTAVGKSSFAIKLAQKIGGTIVNADSMQVYTNLAILTARPTKEDLNLVPHKLYGYVDGSIRYNVARWCNDILKIININKTKNIPTIIVGGTGMYIHSLLNGLIDIPKISENYKIESEKLFNEIGLKKFVELIKTFDQKSIEKISINDSTRLRRIWEVYHSTGISFTEWQKKRNINFLEKDNCKIFLFLPSRDKIYEKVNLRFDKMIESGAINEVKKLLSLNLNKSLPIMRAHGVPEISNYLDKKANLDECIKAGQKVTRNYVKRQLTWWRGSTLPIHQLFDQFPDQIDVNLIKI